MSNVCFRKLRFVVFNRHRKANEGRSLFCNNCVGALVLHDYGLRFDAPTVNLLIHPKDFVEMLSHLGAYMQADMEDITNGNRCPVGLLGGRIQLFFHHYASFDKAKAAWKHRAKRVDYDNIYAVLVERDGCTYEDLQNFDRLPIKRKVALVHKEISGNTMRLCCSWHIGGRGIGADYRVSRMFREAILRPIRLGSFFGPVALVAAHFRLQERTNFRGVQIVSV